MRSALRALAELVTPGRVHYPEVPPMELGMTPNDALENAHPPAWLDSVTLPSDTIDDIVVTREMISFACGNSVVTTRPVGALDVTEFPSRVTALTAHEEKLLAAVDGYGIYELAPGAASRLVCADEAVQNCVTALTGVAGGAVVAAIGSATCKLDEWAWDLFGHKATGSLVRLSADGKVEQTRTGLAWPAGLATGTGSTLLASIAHDHRIEQIDPTSLRRTEDLASGLPSYPWGISHVEGRDTWWVAMPLVRSRFTEMMLEEQEFLDDMMSTVEMRSWYGPSMAGGDVFREPLQLGGLRVLSQIKPWAPPRSYGLVAEIDSQGRVLRSAHSRAGGTTHGVVAAVETNGRLLLASRTRDEPVEVDLEECEVLR